MHAHACLTFRIRGENQAYKSRRWLNGTSGLVLSNVSEEVRMYALVNVYVYVWVTDVRRDFVSLIFRDAANNVGGARANTSASVFKRKYNVFCIL